MAARGEPQVTGHEERDVAYVPIVFAGIGLTVIVVLSFVAMLWLYDFFAAREAALSPPPNPLAAAQGQRLPPEPRLQAAPIEGLQELRATENALLNGYGWVDRRAGIVRIPVDRAIRLLSEQTLSQRDPEKP